MTRLGATSAIAALCCAGASACADDDGIATAQTEGSTSETGATDSETGTSGAVPPAFCEGATQLFYDPMVGALQAYPDDFYTVPADTATGVRLDLRLGENVNIPGLAAAFLSVYEQASTLDGFGTTAGAYFRFNGPLDRGSLPAIDGVAEPSDSLLMVDLDASPPQLVPLVWRLVPESPDNPAETLSIEPVEPLEPARRYGFALTTAAAGLDGGCVAPSATMRALLEGTTTDPALGRTQEAVADVTEALVEAGAIEFPQELTAAVAFTTQTTVDHSVAIATEIQSTQAPTFSPDGPCEDLGADVPYRSCVGVIDTLDFTNTAEAVPGDLSTSGSYDVPVVVYLPKGGSAPWPTILYGHGLGGDRLQASFLADFAAGENHAVIAIDAPKHGDHPDTGEDAVLDFFGLSGELIDPLDAFKLRDNFRQGTYDKLQLLEAVREGIDADGDGQVDLDIERFHYLGVSLGGIMGAEFVALAPDVDTATMIVPGARVTSIVQDGASFASLLQTFASAATDGEIARFFPFLQGVIDRGDAGVYARHVLPGRRLPGFDRQAPQVLMQMVLSDNTVPNTANGYYARALGAPLVGEQRLAIGVAHEPELPTAGNIDATHTAGVFQFDDLETGVMASHANIATSEVAQTQIRRFLLTHQTGTPSEILDPY